MPSSVLRVVPGHLYDFPHYYELVFGSDWRAEFLFLRAAFARFAQRKVASLFEPACGTGRLLYRLKRAGYAVAGNDLNSKAVEYCNRRFARNGWRPCAVVQDMSDFRLRRPVDAAFNLINSFRHLPDERSALAHLRCVAAALHPGGLYLLGLHLTPTRSTLDDEESWSARRGNLQVNSRLWSISINRATRCERVGMSFDVYTPTRAFQLRDETTFRTYTAAQMQELLGKVPSLECVERFDFHYDINHPITIDGRTQDVVYVLRKR